jgi:7-cyano-7-deazaguanine tRNA-ribosyltransferase
MLVNAPVQGSTFPDLREEAGRHATETDLDVFPVGAMVPLLNSYRYAEVVEAVRAAKRGLDPDAPVHLFGAGHPMMLALAVAAGCDLFDSAAYALMARDGRYLTVSGTEHLEEMEYFPCSCPVCAEHTPAELREMEGSDGEGDGGADASAERLLAEHNLHVTFEELRRVKAAIRSGNLLELVDRRARGHPAMLDGYRALLDHADELERTDPVSKDAFFYTSHESARRPEIRRHRDRLARLEVPDRLLLTESNAPSTHDYDAVWRVKPPLGPFPRALSETYPLTAEVPERLDEAARVAAAEGVAALASANPDTEITLGHDGWSEAALDAVPDRVETEDLRTLGRSG